MRRVIFLLIASLLLWCGTLLLYLSLYDISQSQGRAAWVGAFLGAIGGIWLWTLFFGATLDFPRLLRLGLWQYAISRLPNSKSDQLSREDEFIDRGSTT